MAAVSTRFTPGSHDSVRRVSLAVSGVVSIVVIVMYAVVVRDCFGAVSGGLEDVHPSVVLLDGPNGRNEGDFSAVINLDPFAELEGSIVGCGYPNRGATAPSSATEASKEGIQRLQKSVTSDVRTRRFAVAGHYRWRNSHSLTERSCSGGSHSFWRTYERRLGSI